MNKTDKSYRDLVNSAFACNRAIYELRHPIPGLRHDKVSRYVAHRFPVKGGFTIAQVLEEQVMQANPLMSLFKSRRVEQSTVRLSDDGKTV